MAKYRVQTLNNISPIGLAELPDDAYKTAPDMQQPDAILLRSANLHDTVIDATVRAIGRAGAGTNNIPVEQMTDRGVPVFNTPGANANAVKELVLCAMLLAARNLPAALSYVSQLDAKDEDLQRKVEDGKKAYAGFELAGRTLGVVGLGRIGCLVADAAISLGMKVIGYDPSITVDAAWSLPSQVRRAPELITLLRASDFVTIHVPLVEATRRMIDAEALEHAKNQSVLMNFSRGGIVDEQAVLAALETGTLAKYVCDFPSPHIHGHPQVIALPHLGASTREAEENCAVMVARQLRDYLEHGVVVNSVNFPEVSMPRESNYRIAIANANVPNMLGQISTEMAKASLNIHNMINKSRGQVAYTLVDVDSPVQPAAIKALGQIEGVLSVRYLATQ